MLMRIWIIKMLYRSLPPSDQFECQRHIKAPSIDSVWADCHDKLEQIWEARGWK